MKDFNIIITGVGGQGLITVLRILAEAALLQGFDVKTSELHGLSQRQGSISAHLRFGKQIHSPLIGMGQADLIFALEMSEALRAIDFSNKNTIFVINKKFISYLGGSKQEQVLKKIKKIPAKIHLVEASKICQEKLKQEIVVGVYLLGYAVKNDFLPLKQKNILKAIKKIIPKEFLSINKKAFQLNS